VDDAEELVRIEPVRSQLTVGSVEIGMSEIRLPGVPRGMVLLLLPPDGLDDEAPELMNRLAAHGYESMAVEAEAPSGTVKTLFEQAAERGWTTEQLGVVGVREGAELALRAAMELPIGAAVSISPRLTSYSDEPGGPGRLEAMARALRAPWLCLVGGSDPAAPGPVVRSLAAALDEQAPVHGAVVSYPAAGPGFHRELGNGRSYDASYDAWERTVEWLGARVVPRLTPRAAAWRCSRGLAPQLV
jgi:carboxymethylenebutenolidase